MALTDGVPQSTIEPLPERYINFFCVSVFALHGAKTETQNKIGSTMLPQAKRRLKAPWLAP
jgi:hypothetical protein